MRILALVTASVVAIAAQNPRIVPTPRPIVGELPAAPAEAYLPDPPGVSVETWIAGLEAVWSLQFAPDGRLFLTEKFGRIRTASAKGQLDPGPWASIRVMQEGGEGGLMGLALHPDFPREPWVYVMYTG